MKTSTLKAALVILSLFATTAVQAQIDAIDHETMEGKIQAAMAQQAAGHNPLHKAVKMKMELDSIAKNIDELQNEVGYSTDNSNGAIKALADKMLMIEELQADFLATDKEIQKEHGYGLALRLDEADQIVKKARVIKKEAKAIVEKAKGFTAQDSE